MTAIKARLALELYRYLVPMLPSRVRMYLKRYIDANRAEWTQIGMLSVSLADTPYQLLLDMRHWHQRWTYVKGHYPEPHITHALDQYLDAGALYIDIGANVGVHVVYGAHCVGASGHCIAFEPNPHSFERLNQQIQRNHLTQVTAHHTALGDQAGSIILHGCHDENVGSTLRPNTQQADDDCEVPLNRADMFLTDIPEEQVGLCKIDVEGFEFQVVQGLSHFLSRHPRMVYIVEVTDEWLRLSGASASQLFALFQQHQFHAHYIDPHTAVTQPLTEPLPDQQYDVLFKRID
ncbi:MAG: FkbM family methyltransferase [Anaerolineae bacterium]